MPFIEYNNIENMTGSSNSYAWVYSLLGVMVGFGLNYFHSRYLRNKEIERVGNLFEAGILNISEELKAQYKYITDYEKLIKEQTVGTLGIVFLYENNYFQSIDRVTLFKYYYNLRNNKKRKTFFNINTITKVTSEHIYVSINKAFNHIGVIYSEVSRLVDVSKSFTKELDDNGALYATTMNKLGRSIINYMYKVGTENFKQDRFAMHLHQLIKENKEDLSLFNIVTFEEKIHNKIFNLDFKFSEHPLFDSASEFDATGISIINTIRAAVREKMDFLDLLKTTLADRYRDLFKEDI